MGSRSDSNSPTRSLSRATGPGHSRGGFERDRRAGSQVVHAAKRHGRTRRRRPLVERAVEGGARVELGQTVFVVLDCTAIPSALAESVLFGHEKGAFTGASERRLGVFEAANGGTVFVDEIGELEAADVRVVSATLRDLRTMINDGRFREDSVLPPRARPTGPAAAPCASRGHSAPRKALSA